MRNIYVSPLKIALTLLQVVIGDDSRLDPFAMVGAGSKLVAGTVVGSQTVHDAKRTRARAAKPVQAPAGSDAAPTPSTDLSAAQTAAWQVRILPWWPHAA